MSITTDIPATNDVGSTRQELPAFRLVQSSKTIRRFANLLLFLLLLTIPAMALLPWQQSARGAGNVIAYVPQERQQAVVSPIKGIVARVAPDLKEGQRVKKGDFIVELEPSAPDLVEQLRSQQNDLETKMATSKAKADLYSQNIVDFSDARDFALMAAQQMVEAAEEKYAAKVSLLSGYEAKELQARLNYERQNELFGKGIKPEKEIEKLKKDLDVAVSDLESGRREVAAAQKEIDAKRNELQQKQREMQTKVDYARTMLEDAKGQQATVQKEIRDVQIKLSSLGRQTIVAPKDGTIFRLPIFEQSQVVKEGEELFTIVPDSTERAVELWISGNDTPLVNAGDHVRLQFEGFPAIQFSGMPDLAAGTFGGEVVAVDPTDDGTGKFRVQIVPENESDWPNLRQGARANGWVMLSEVTLGFEIWRQLNGFPPIMKKDDSKDGGGEEESEVTKMKSQGWLSVAFFLLFVPVGCNHLPKRPSANKSLPVASSKTESQTPRKSHSHDVNAAVVTLGEVVPDGKTPSTDADVSPIQQVSFRPQVDDVALPPAEVPAPTPPSIPPLNPVPDTNVQFQPLPPSVGQVIEFSEPTDFALLGPEIQEPLTLAEVLQSVETSYPLLEVAFAEQQVAAGKELSAWGEFDLMAKAYSIAAPMGFYKTYRSVAEVNQPLYGGGYVYSGYKIGDGKFQPWFKERETNEGGEFSAGIGVPLLKNRQIDSRRSGVMQAALARQATGPAAQAMLLQFTQEASYAYWSWVAAGRSLRATEDLLDLAKQRVDQVNDRVRVGDLEKIADIDNRRLIADRETKLIETARKFQLSSFKLSLFLRTPEGEPMVVDEPRVPTEVPSLVAVDSNQMMSDIAQAVATRPEISEIDLIIQQNQVELAEARNSLLPKLDAAVGAAKDVGARTSSSGDKTPFELEAGLYGEVPLQRRGARGKVQAAAAKIRQLRAKREFIVNKITVAVQDAYSALEAARLRIDRAETNLELAKQSLEISEGRFDSGDIDLIVLNIYEKAVTDADLVRIEAESEFFKALADYRAALAMPSLDETL